MYVVDSLAINGVRTQWDVNEAHYRSPMHAPQCACSSKQLFSFTNICRYYYRLFVSHIYVRTIIMSTAVT